jgi:hypothetical protein
MNLQTKSMEPSQQAHIYGRLCVTYEYVLFRTEAGEQAVAKTSETSKPECEFRLAPNDDAYPGI